MSVIELVQETGIDGTPSPIWRGPKNEYVSMYAVTNHPDQRPGPEHVVYEIEGCEGLTPGELDEVVAAFQEFKRKYPPHLVRPAVLPGHYQLSAVKGDEDGYWYAHRTTTEALFCEAVFDPHEGEGIRYVVETPLQSRPMTLAELGQFVELITGFHAACVAEARGGEDR